MTHLRGPLRALSGNDKGDIEVAGNPDKQWSWVHVTDLGNAFVAVAGAGKDVIGERGRGLAALPRCLIRSSTIPRLR